jgi:hypothetical protein
MKTFEIFQGLADVIGLTPEGDEILGPGSFYIEPLENGAVAGELIGPFPTREAAENFNA